MKTIALVIGFVLLALGVAGFIPQLNPDGQLFGVLPMDHIMAGLFAVSGVAGIAIGLTGRRQVAPPANASGNDMRPWV